MKKNIIPYILFFLVIAGFLAIDYYHFNYIIRDGQFTAWTTFRYALYKYKPYVRPFIILSSISIVSLIITCWLVHRKKRLSLKGYLLLLHSFTQKLKTVGCNSKVQLSALTIIVLLLFAAIYKQPSSKLHAFYESGGHCAAIGDVIQGSPATQLISSPENNLAAVSVLLATWGRPNQCELTFQIKQLKTDKILASKTYKTIRDNTFHTLTFPPVKDSKNQTFELKFFSKDGSPGNAYTVWLSNDSNPKHKTSLGEAPFPNLSFRLKMYQAKPSHAKIIGKWIFVMLLIGYYILSILFITKNRIFNIGRYLFEKRLVRFKPSVLLVIYCVFWTFIILTSFKINYSSIEMWNAYVPYEATSQDSLVAGHAKAIRSDEWAVSTPNFLNRYNQFFMNEKSLYSIVNKLSNPLDFSSFFLPKEYYFAYRDNFTLLFGSLSLFLVLLILTGNNVPISLWATLFLVCSSHNRWWGNGGEILNFYTTLFFGLYFLFAQRKRTIVMGFLLFCIFAKCYVLSIYPPWQVTSGYLGLIIFAGLCLQNKNWKLLLKNYKLKIALLAFMAIGGVVFAGVWYMANRANLEVMMNTVYPGRRISTGGGIDLTRLFSGLFDYYMDQSRFVYGNICESSSYILLFPSAIIAFCFFMRKKFSFPFLFVALYLLVLVTYVMVGFPAPLAKLTAFCFVPSSRTTMVLGWSSILLTAIFISYRKPIKASLYSNIAFVLLTLCTLFSIYYYISHSNSATRLFNKQELLLLVLGYAFSSLLLIYSLAHPFFRLLFMAFSLIFVIVPSIGVNPVMTGMSPIYGKSIVKEVSKVYQKDPSAKWLVGGSWLYSQILSSTGIETISGNQFPPNLKDMAILDPEQKSTYVYNRYANIDVTINDKKQPPIFHLNSTDNYNLKIYPASSLLRKINVKYVVLSATENPERLADYAKDGLVPLTGKSANGFMIFKFKEKDSQ